MTRHFIQLVTALPLMLSSTVSTAQEATAARTPGEVSNITMEISNQIYSPFCPGKTLVMCPSPGAAEVRQKIQVMAREGKTREEIKQNILATYGEEFRIVEPPPQDNVMLGLALGLGLVLCVTAVWAFSRRRAGKQDEPALQTDEHLSDEDKDYLRALREEVQD